MKNNDSWAQYINGKFYADGWTTKEVVRNLIQLYDIETFCWFYIFNELPQSIMWRKE